MKNLALFGNLWHAFLCGIGMHDFMPWRVIAKSKKWVYTKRRECLYCRYTQTKHIHPDFPVQ